MELISTVLGSMGFNWKMALFDVINFLILFALLRKFLFGKILNVIKERQTKIDEGLENAEKIKIELEKAERTATQIIEKGKDDSKAIIQKAYEEAEQLGAKMKLETEEEIRKMSERAQKQLETEKEKLVADLHDKTADIVVAAVEKVIKAKLDSDSDKKLISQALEQIK